MNTIININKYNFETSIIEDILLNKNLHTKIYFKNIILLISAKIEAKIAYYCNIKF